MTKKKKQFAAMGLILLAMYHIVLFAIAGFADHEAPFWISYIFVLLSFGMAAVSVRLLGESGMPLRDWLFGYPIVRHCAIYVVLELVLSVVFMAFEYDISWVVAFVIQVLLMGFYGILLLSCFVSKTSIDEVHQKVEKKTRYIALLQADAVLLCQKCEDAQVKKQLEQLAEAIRYSDPMSADALSSVETELSETLTACDQALNDGNYVQANHLCEKAMRLLSERNLKCKALK